VGNKVLSTGIHTSQFSEAVNIEKDKPVVGLMAETIGG
jgi:hypothetical protein